MAQEERLRSHSLPGRPQALVGRGVCMQLELRLESGCRRPSETSPDSQLGSPNTVERRSRGNALELTLGVNTPAGLRTPPGISEETHLEPLICRPWGMEARALPSTAPAVAR